MASLLETIYIATETGLSISRNGGKSYRVRRKEHGLGGDSCRSVSAEDGVVFVATNNGLSISTDAGDSFVNKTTRDGLPSNDCRFVESVKNGIAVVSTDKGAALTRDYGKTFKVFSVENGLLPSNICNDSVIQENGLIAIGTRNGLAISRDFGNTFSFYLESINVVDVWVNYEQNFMYILSDNAVYRTPYTFQGAIAGPYRYGFSASEKLQTITTDEAGIVYVGSDKHLYMSNDKGITFSVMELKLDGDSIYANVRDVKALRYMYLDTAHMGEGEDLEDTTSWGFHSDAFDHDIRYTNGNVTVKFQNKRIDSSWVDFFVRPYEGTVSEYRMTKNNTVHSISLPFPPGDVLQYWFKYEDVESTSPESEVFTFNVPGFKPIISHRVTLPTDGSVKIHFRLGNGVATDVSVTLDGVTKQLVARENSYLIAEFVRSISANSKYSFNFTVDGIAYTSNEYQCEPTSAISFGESVTQLYPNNTSLEINGLSNATSVAITYKRDNNTDVTTYIGKTAEGLFRFEFPSSATFSVIKYTLVVLLNGVEYCSPVKLIESENYSSDFTTDFTFDKFTGIITGSFTPNNFVPDRVRLVYNGVTSDIDIGSGTNYQFEAKLNPGDTYSAQFFYTLYGQEKATDAFSGTYVLPTEEEMLQYYLTNPNFGTPSSDYDVTLNGGTPSSVLENSVNGNV